MSEFRKCRLLSKLADSFGLSEAPQKYSAVLGDGGKIDNKLDLNFILGKCENPSLLMQTISELRQYDSACTNNMLVFLQHYLTIKTLSNSRTDALKESGFYPFAPSTMQGNSALENIRPSSEYMKSFNTDALEVVVGKLDRAQHRLGLMDPKATSVNGGDLEGPASGVLSSQLKLNTFENEFQWVASSYPLPVQELLVIEDLLYLLIGISGRFIIKDRMDPNGFLIDSTLSPTLVQTILKCINAAHSFATIEIFIKSQNLGRVHQALCASLSNFLQEFRNVIVSLERKFTLGGLGLQQLSFHLQPYQKNLQVIAEFVKEISQKNAVGGAILALLEEKASVFSGDRVLKGLFEDLLIRCSVPFLGMLQAWLERGALDDPFGEFMIRRRVEIDAPLYGKNTQNLTAGFLKVESNTPSLVSPCLVKIIEVGAFHNILMGYEMSEAGEYLGDSIDASCLVYDQRKMLSIVDRCYGKVNRRMLTELLNGDRFASTLSLCKKFFFLENSNLISTFLDFHRRELDRPIGAVVKEHVHAGWETAKQTCGVDLDGLECYLSDLPLIDQLQRIIGLQENQKSSSTNTTITGIDHFGIRIRVAFPETLIFNEENLAKYEMVFRFLFKVQDLLRQLMKPVGSVPKSKSGPLKSISLLARQMRIFLQNLQNYLYYDVFEHNWNILMLEIPKANGMDNIIQMHTKFIDTCLRQSMLSNAKLIQMIFQLFSDCTRMQNLLQHGLAASDAHANASMIQQLYTTDIKKTLDMLAYYTNRDYEYYLGNLLTRLEYNSYHHSAVYGSQLMDPNRQSLEDSGTTPRDRPSLQQHVPYQIYGGLAQ